MRRKEIYALAWTCRLYLSNWTRLGVYCWVWFSKNSPKVLSLSCISSICFTDLLPSLLWELLTCTARSLRRENAPLMSFVSLRKTRSTTRFARALDVSLIIIKICISWRVVVNGWHLIIPASNIYTLNKTTSSPGDTFSVAVIHWSTIFNVYGSFHQTTI